MALSGVMGGYLEAQQAQDARDTARQGQLAQLLQMRGLAQQQEVQQQQLQSDQAIRQIMSSDAPMPVKQQLIMRLPGGLKVANELAGYESLRLEAEQKAREAAVFSPENLARNMTPGRPAQEAIPANEMDTVGTEARAATPATLNMAALRQQAAMTGPKGFELYQNHLAQEAQRKDALEARLYDIEVRSQDKNLSLLQQKNLAEQGMALRRDLAAIQANIAAGNLELRRMEADRRAEEARRGKPLPSVLQKELTAAAELADATTRFATTFQPKFGGKTVMGEASNVYGRLMGDDTGQAQWWQDYELHQSQVRNKLFGSALTDSEIKAWNKSAINPRMDATQIQENLDRRRKLEETGINRLMRGAAVTYNKDQIEAFTGRPIPPAMPNRGASDSFVVTPEDEALINRYLGNQKAR